MTDAEIEVVCDDCNGAGHGKSSQSDCPTCEGAGWVWYPADEYEADGRVRWDG